MGFYVGLSTNGTLIDVAMADRTAGVGYDYVGVSLDGIGVEPPPGTAIHVVRLLFGCVASVFFFKVLFEDMLGVVRF